MPADPTEYRIEFTVQRRMTLMRFEPTARVVRDAG